MMESNQEWEKWGVTARENRKRKLLLGLDESLISCFRFNLESEYSFTSLVAGNKICDTIMEVGLELGITKDSVVTDATAGVGGSAIAFGSRFNNVQAVEVDRSTRELLLHNLRLLNLTNVVVYHGYYQHYIGKLKQDIIFIDAPWNPDREKDKQLSMFLSTPKDDDALPLEHVIEIAAPHAKMCVVKLPINYDMDYFSHYVNRVGKIQKHYLMRSPNHTQIAIVVYSQSQL